MYSLKIAQKPVCAFYVLINAAKLKVPTTLFPVFVCTRILYLIQHSDTKTVHMQDGLYFQGRQKKATPSPMCVCDTFLYRLHFLCCKNVQLR